MRITAAFDPPGHRVHSVNALLLILSALFDHQIAAKVVGSFAVISGSSIE